MYTLILIGFISFNMNGHGITTIQTISFQTKEECDKAASTVAAQNVGKLGAFCVGGK